MWAPSLRAGPAADAAVVSLRNVLSSISPPADAPVPQPPAGAPGPGERTPEHQPACRGCGDVEGSLRIASWVDDDGRGVLSRFDVGPAHQGAPGILHGGLLIAAFDESMGSAHSLFERPAVTARLETDFRAPVPVGRTTWLRSRVDAIEGRKLFVSSTAHLDDPDGPVAGTACALFLEVGEEHFLRHGRPEDLVAAGLVPAVRDDG